MYKRVPTPLASDRTEPGLHFMCRRGRAAKGDVQFACEIDEKVEEKKAETGSRRDQESRAIHHVENKKEHK